eukprot:TRINITY_DN181_c1_g1_i5.p1 TRINITY_DN181_c1_g1~~TRINITY_DN181_c1_g1_i5.p1  ORF type:complete len:608 (-),score=232.62 TRINITY_DN181_c1_g1_i5:75-1898(-)
MSAALRLMASFKLAEQEFGIPSVLSADKFDSNTREDITACAPVPFHVPLPLCLAPCLHRYITEFMHYENLAKLGKAHNAKAISLEKQRLEAEATELQKKIEEQKKQQEEKEARIAVLRKQHEELQAENEQQERQHAAQAAATAEEARTIDQRAAQRREELEVQLHEAEELRRKQEDTMQAARLLEEHRQALAQQEGMARLQAQDLQRVHEEMYRQIQQRSQEAHQLQLMQEEAQRREAEEKQRREEAGRSLAEAEARSRALAERQEVQRRKSEAMAKVLAERREAMDRKQKELATLQQQRKDVEHGLEEMRAKKQAEEAALKREQENLERLVEENDKKVVQLKQTGEMLKGEVQKSQQECELERERLVSEKDKNEKLLQQFAKETCLVRQGSLTKQGNLLRDHRRWFVLKPDGLYYFDSPDDLYRPVGVIPLEQITDTVMIKSSTANRFLFSVTTNKKSYTFVAKTQDEAQQWVNDIRSFSDRLSDICPTPLTQQLKLKTPPSLLLKVGTAGGTSSAPLHPATQHQQLQKPKQEQEPEPAPAQQQEPAKEKEAPTSAPAAPPVVTPVEPVVTPVATPAVTPATPAPVQQQAPPQAKGGWKLAAKKPH